MKSPCSIFLCLALALSAADITSFKTPDNSWDEAFASARKTDRQITLPRGVYNLERTIEVEDGLTLVFDDGAELVTSISPMIKHTGGVLVMEGRGQPGVL